MKHLKYLLMAALVAMPMTACDEDDDGPTVDPVPIGTVTGTVSAEGTGLAGVAVSLVGATTQSATTAAGGTYTFTNVPAGSYGVSIDASSHADVSFSQTSRTTSIATMGETQTVDFTGSYVRTASVTGVVSAGGAPLAGVTVAVTGGPDAVTLSESTGLGGEFAVSGLRAGSYTVTISNTPTGVSFTSMTQTVSVATGEIGTAHFVGAAVEMATVSGAVVIDNVGTAGITVTLSGGAVALTGAGGVFTFTNLTPGSYTVTVTAPATIDFGSGAGVDVTSAAVAVAAGETGVVNFVGVGPVEPATISIDNISYNPGGGSVPVMLNNVFGQIEVELNITRGDRDLDRVEVWIGDEVVAAQSFAPAAPGAEAAAGDDEDITLSVPTNQVEMATNAYIPVVFNGSNNISAKLYEVGADAPIPTNDVPVVMNNPEVVLPGAVTFDHSAGVDCIVGAGSNTWCNGTLEFGDYEFLSFSTIAPLTVSFANAASTAVCTIATGVTGLPTTGQLINNTYTCAASEGTIAPNPTGALTVTYAAGAVPPDGSAFGAPAGFSALGAEFTLGGETRFMIIPVAPVMPTITTRYVDNLGPTITIPLPIAFNSLWDEAWVNPNMVLADFVTVADAGVGPDATSAAVLAYDASVPACGAVIVNADLAETNTSDPAVDGHQVCGTGVDLLNNPAQTPLPVSNGFGKDALAPDVHMFEQSPGAVVPGADALAACTDPGLTAGLNHSDNVFNMAAGFPVLVPVAGFGVEAIDDRAGFHKDDAAQDGPVVQTVTRTYPDPATDGVLTDVATGEEWLKLVLSNNYVRSSTFAAAEDCMLHYVNALNEPGYFIWEATVTDMAGNTASLSQDWAVDEAAAPVHTNMIMGPIPFTAGQPGLFQIYGSDDFEVASVQVSMTYPVDLALDGGAPDLLEVVYPAQAVDATQSIWDMDYPFDRLQPYDYMAGLLGQGILGRIDFTDNTGATAAALADYNQIDTDTDGTPEDDDHLPTATTGWIADDIGGNGPSAGSTTVNFIGADFGGWTNSTAAPWPIVADNIITTWELLDTGAAGDTEDLVAQHTAPNSVVNPFFDAVVLIHNDGAGTLTVCGEMSVMTQQDQGFNRFYRYALPPTPTLPDACVNAANPEVFHAAGVVSSADGAALLVTEATVSIIHP